MTSSSSALILKFGNIEAHIARFVLFFLLISFANGELIHVIQIFRHGTRGPMVLDFDYYKSWQNETN